MYRPAGITKNKININTNSSSYNLMNGNSNNCNFL